MRKKLVNLSLSVVFILSISSSASAAIDSITSLACPNPACLPAFVQPVILGRDNSMTIKGHFVDHATRVEIVNPNGVNGRFGPRAAAGANSSVVIIFDVGPNARLGEREVRLRYPLEPNGPDTFRIRVVRGGIVESIQYREPLPTANAGNRNNTNIDNLPKLPGAKLVAPTAIPVNQTVTLVFTGTNIGNANMIPTSSLPVRNVNVLPGCSETRCEIEMVFTQTGVHQAGIFDRGIGNIITSAVFNFYYTGARQVTVVGNTEPTLSSVSSPGAVRGTGGNAPFIDVVPQPTMLNIFRRLSGGQSFTKDGAQYFQINSEQFCRGMSGNQSQVITVPDLKWGVSNIGTAPINSPFNAQLKTGNTVLDSPPPITRMNPGQTIEFTYRRQNSQVSVFTFLDRSGCYISPSANRYFEDPQFTVVVDSNSALNEAVETNNSRNY